MKISDEEKQKLEQTYQSFLNDPKILRMKDIPMHRGSNCYVHVFKVAKRAIKKALKSKNKNIDLEVVLVGAILHDYYLYDWRKDRSLLKGHGKRHQYVASKNAKEDFNISDEVKLVIDSHMWPMNIKEFPKSKEAKIVTLSDKAIAIAESFTSKKHKENKKEYYLNYISHLF